MRNIFLDCGANIGNSVDMFLDKYPKANQYEIFSFEANPKQKKFFENKKTNFFNKAVWVKDGTLRFYLGKSEKSESSSVYKHKKTGRLSLTPTIVPCIDFSKWIMDTFSKDDNIILKLDIEGAEYDVLKKMFKDKSIDYIKKLYVDWHWNKVDYPQEQHNHLVDKLKKIGIIPYNWDAAKQNIEDLT